MLKQFILFFMLPVLILSNTGCGIIKPSWLKEENSTVVERPDNEVIEGIDGPTGGHFNPDGEWLPDNPQIAMTYKLPDIGSGIIVDLADLHKVNVSPTLQVELFEFNSRIPYLETLKIDFGVAYNKTYFYIGKLWTNIFEITTGVVVGWDYENKRIMYGLGGTIIRF